MRSKNAKLVSFNDEANTNYKEVSGHDDIILRSSQGMVKDLPPLDYFLGLYDSLDWIDTVDWNNVVSQEFCNLATT